MSAGGSSSSGRQTLTETGLSKEQLAILKQREQQFQSIFFPELVAALKATTGPTAGTELGVTGTKAVNQAFETGGQTFGKAMAQRGLRGSGIETLGLADMASARSSALADAMMNAKLQNQNRLLQLLQMGGALAPTPTTAVPMGSKTKESKTGWEVTGKDIARWGLAPVTGGASLLIP